MDWQGIITAVVIVVGGGSLAGLAWWIKIGRTLEGRGAERFANDWLQKVIERQDKEAERLRDEIQNLRDQRRQDQDIWRERMETLRREYTEFRGKAELEFNVQRKVSQATARDLRKINDGRIPEERLDTVILVSGYGPLDP